ncbi:restriction endonuclease subunit S [Psychrobacter celer]|uniref:restriction endonuclease subunit S n=1 Tax=Psychrobacter celer TaxID=306572 RepID=UPI003FD2E6D3
MATPKLRFKEFSNDLDVESLNDIVVFSKGKGLSKADISSDGKNPCIRYGELYTTYGQVIDNIISKTNIKKSDCILSQAGDVIIPASGETQIDIATAACVLHDGIILSGDLNILSHKENGAWLAYYLSSAKKLEMARFAQGNSVVHLYSRQLKDIKINKPNLKEQTKIATFLSAVDTKIDELIQKHELLTDYKKGMMQQIFSQKLRFKADDGSDFEDWTQCTLSEIATRVTRKNKEGNQNPLTISAQMGLINQQKYFNKQVASKNLSNYYLLYKGEYAYNKSYSAGYPMGVIKRLKNYDKGAVSTLYICFSLNNKINTDFFEHYVESGNLIQELEKIAQEGARNHGLLNVGIKEFFEINLSTPCLKEQTKIANFLTAIDQKIDNVAEQIDHAKTWKKGLLQQMFV